jgi:protein-disulfide isomerase
MYDALYRHQDALTLRDLRGYADEIGVDGAAVAAAVRANTYHDRIERDVTSGNGSGIDGTPALFINGYAYDDEITVEALSDVIERALAAHAAR